jgi:hypothetical protein
MDFDPLKHHKEVGRRRVRMPAVIAEHLNWSNSNLDISCIAVFTAPGELMCSKSEATNSDGIHPLQEAITQRESWKNTDQTSLSQLALATFMTSRRIFDFNAKWTKDRAQMHLELGLATTHLLGWVSDSNENPPIFPVVRDQILILWSRDRFEELLRTSIS